jgi:hypothetical protein
MPEVKEMPEVKDFQEIRTQQAKLAEQLTRELLQRLEPRFSEAARVKAQQAGVPAGEIDQGVLHELMRQDLFREVALSLRGFSDWLGSALWRKRLAEGRWAEEEAVPGSVRHQREGIALKYGVETDVLSLVISQFMEGKYDLPGVGRIECGSVRVDADALTRWASYYDWE